MEDGDGVYAVVTFDERLGEFNGDKEMASAWRRYEDDILLLHLFFFSLSISCVFLLVW